MQTVVGLFDDYETAQRVVAALQASGFSAQDVYIESSRSSATAGAAGSADQSFGTRISNFFGSLFGDDVTTDERGHYAEAIRRGGALVSVKADDDQAARVEDVFHQYGAIDIDERAAHYKQRGYLGYDVNAAPYTADEVAQERQQYSTRGARHLDEGGEVTLPVVEEELAVGKRVIERGGVRVVSRVTESPVEETVRLREERVRVDRRPVDRAVSDADLANFQEGTIELTERAEEAVVTKQARVVEEVLVGKEVTEREETVRDTVRRTDVDVEEIDTTEPRTGSTTRRKSSGKS